MDRLFKNIISRIDKDEKIKSLCVGLFGTAILSTTVGFAYNFGRKKGHCHDGLENAGGYVGKSAKKTANYVFSDNPIESSVGVSAINSLIKAKGIELNGMDLIRKRIPKKNVSVVGHFPIVDEFRTIAKNLFCFELQPEGADLPAKDFSKHAKKSDVIVITGSTFVGRTLVDLLDAGFGKEIYIIGPSTIMSDVLFDYGVTCLCGISVQNPQLAYRSVCEGGNFRKIKGAKQVVMTAPKFSGIYD